MAEGGLDVDTDVNKVLPSCTDASPSVTDVLAMTVDELRTELRIRVLTLREIPNPSYRRYTCSL